MLPSLKFPLKLALMDFYPFENNLVGIEAGLLVNKPVLHTEKLVLHVVRAGPELTAFRSSQFMSHCT